MTSEIAILNYSGVALAADSALTIGGRRVWNHANKLYSLGPHHDIGVMIFGNAEYCGIPWEVIIKKYRASHSDREFKTVDECSASFFKYIQTDEFADGRNESYAFGSLLLDRLSRIKKHLKYDKKIEFRERLVAIMSQIEAQSENDLVWICNQNEFSDYMSEIAQEIAKDVFGEKITKKLNAKIVEFAYFLICRNIESELSTGIVFAGFGTEELFPNLVEYCVDGRMNLVTRYWKADSHNMNGPNAEPPAIVPFAQGDMIGLFMEGMHRSYSEWLRRTLRSVLNSQIDSVVEAYVPEAEQIVEKTIRRKENATAVSEFLKEFRDFRFQQSVNPILTIVEALPKEEMAAMAGALVEITSLKRRVDSNVESVGGPTDVAVISKGDGFVWIRRKHYFDWSLNRDFGWRKELKRRQKEDPRHDGAE